MTLSMVVLVCFFPLNIVSASCDSFVLTLSAWCCIHVVCSGVTKTNLLRELELEMCTVTGTSLNARLTDILLFNTHYVVIGVLFSVSMICCTTQTHSLHF